MEIFFSPSILPNTHLPTSYKERELPFVRPWKEARRGEGVEILPWRSRIRQKKPRTLGKTVKKKATEVGECESPLSRLYRIRLEGRTFHREVEKEKKYRKVTGTQTKKQSRNYNSFGRNSFV